MFYLVKVCFCGYLVDGVFEFYFGESFSVVGFEVVFVGEFCVVEDELVCYVFFGVVEKLMDMGVVFIWFFVKCFCVGVVLVG